MTNRVAAQLRFRGALSQFEHAADILEGVDQPVDLVTGVVDGEARAGRGRYAEALHQDLGAVMAGPGGAPVPVQDLRDVVGVHSIDCERDDPASFLARGWAEDGEAGDLADPLQRV